VTDDGQAEFDEVMDRLDRIHPYYDRDGKPITFRQWSAIMEPMFDGQDVRRVALDEVDGYRISTVWLGIDHSLGGPVPIIFETMIFDDTGEGREFDQWQDRYATEAQAIAGHDQVVAMVREPW
jgi:hypothetical protein